MGAFIDKDKLSGPVLAPVEALDRCYLDGKCAGLAVTCQDAAGGNVVLCKPRNGLVYQLFSVD